MRAVNASKCRYGEGSARTPLGSLQRSTAPLARYWEGKEWLREERERAREGKGTGVRKGKRRERLRGWERRGS